MSSCNFNGHVILRMALAMTLKNYLERFAQRKTEENGNK